MPCCELTSYSDRSIPRMRVHQKISRLRAVLHPTLVRTRVRVKHQSMRLPGPAADPERGGPRASNFSIPLCQLAKPFGLRYPTPPPTGNAAQSGRVPCLRCRSCCGLPFVKMKTLPNCLLSVRDACCAFLVVVAQERLGIHDRAPMNPGVNARPDDFTGTQSGAAFLSRRLQPITGLRAVRGA